MRKQLAALLPLAATVIPVVAGLGLSVALAFGFHTAPHSPNTLVWQQLLRDTALWQSVALSLWTALGSTLLALCTALGIGYTLQHSRLSKQLRGALSALLAVPHAAFAVGFYFLLSPSGWIARLLSPGLSGWQRPPDLATVQDPWGITLLLGLAIKETPFLLLTLLAALPQSKHRDNQLIGRSLGYSAWRCWTTLTVPQLYKQMRLPLLVVFCYGLSVVDMAKVLGPSIPGTLAVRSTAWLHDANPEHWPLGAASALLLLGLSTFSVALWILAERWAKPLIKARWLSGTRAAPVSQLLFQHLLPWAWTAAILSSLAVIVLWSFTWRWRFPDALPSEFSLVFWLRSGQQILEPAWNTLSLGVSSTAISLLAAVILLESRPRLHPAQLAMLYIPLLLPQLAFLFGVQLLLLSTHLDGQWWTLVWVHALFVFPYICISLYGPWQAYEQRYSQLGLSLAKSRWQVWWQIKRPIMLKPLCYACALGFSVSVAQYLSTLFVGAGRFPTLTTEAIALAAGGDRRALAALAFVQMAMPVLAFMIAFAAPKIRFKHRRALQDTL